VLIAADDLNRELGRWFNSDVVTDIFEATLIGG